MNRKVDYRVRVMQSTLDELEAKAAKWDEIQKDLELLDAVKEVLKTRMLIIPEVYDGNCMVEKEVEILVKSDLLNWYREQKRGGE